MVVEWSVECSADDPVLVVPWSRSEAGAESSPDGGDFVDLRENPYDLDQIPEAEQNPPLMQALRALNGARSSVFTAKCDAWEMNAQELEQLRLHLDLDTDLSAYGSAEDMEATAGFASYIDLIWRDRAIFASFHQNEQILHRLERLAAPIDEPLAMLDCILRPAFVDLAGPQEGFAVSVYVKALGPDRPSAKQVWSSALEAIVTLLRSKDIAMA